MFALTRAGTYETLAEYTISDGRGGGGSGERFTLTDEDVLASTRRSRDATASALRETTAEACRQAASCDECAALTGCGWSLVRRRCYRAHPIATTADALECAELPEATTKTVDAWLNQANALVLGRDGYGPRAMRNAFRALERASEAAKADAAKAGEAGTPAAKAAAAGRKSARCARSSRQSRGCL